MLIDFEAEGLARLWVQLLVHFQALNKPFVAEARKAVSEFRDVAGQHSRREELNSSNHY